MYFVVAGGFVKGRTSVPLSVYVALILTRTVCLFVQRCLWIHCVRAQLAYLGIFSGYHLHGEDICAEGPRGTSTFVEQTAPRRGNYYLTFVHSRLLLCVRRCRYLCSQVGCGADFVLIRGGGGGCGIGLHKIHCC